MPKKTKNSATARKLTAKLKFPLEGLTDALLQQPSLFLEAAEYNVEQRLAVRKAEVNLRKTEVSVANSIREDAAESGIKVTVAAVNDRTSAHKNVVAARKRLDAARTESEYAGAILEAFRMRKSVARELVQLSLIDTARKSDFVLAELQRLELELKDAHGAAKE